MPARHAINVSLTPELDQFTRHLVASGRYASASEVVRGGLRLLEEHEAQTADLRQLLADRIARAAGGAAVPFDADRLRSRLTDRAAQRRADASGEPSGGE